MATFSPASRFQPGMLANSVVGKYAQLGAKNDLAQAPTPAPANPGGGPATPINPPLSQPAQQQPQVKQDSGIVQPAGAQPRQPVFRQPAQPRPMPQQFAQPQMPQQPQQSLTNQMGRGNAQQISNYMNALRQVGAGGNNAAMNSGQLGAGAQAGFRGFGQNGMQTQLGGQFVGPQQQFTPLQYQQNQAAMGPMSWAGNQAYSPGLSYAAAPQLANAGGVTPTTAGLASGQGIPQYTVPQPWLNQKNMPTSTQQWEDYFTGKYDPNMNPNVPQQQGAMYTSGFERGPDPNAPPPTPEQIQASTDALNKSAEENQAMYPWEFWKWSDERLKDNIQYAEPELEEFVNALGAYSYEYKNPEHGDKRYISPMAQDFEKSQLGKRAVITDPASGYKMVDYGQFENGRLKGVELASLAMINKKVNDLKGQIKDIVKQELSKKKRK